MSSAPLAGLVIAALAAGCGGDDAEAVGWRPDWAAVARVTGSVEALGVSARGDVFALEAPSRVRSFDAAAGAWSPPTDLADLEARWLLVDDAGGALAVGSTSLGDLVARRLTPGQHGMTWTTEEIRRRPAGGWIDPPAPAMTGSGVAAVAWRETSGDGQDWTSLIAIHDAGVGWTAPIAIVGASPHAELAIAVADLGAEVKVVTTWIAVEPDFSAARVVANVLHVRRADRQATWEEPAELVAIEPGTATPLVGIDRTGGASVVIAEPARLTLVRHAREWQAPVVVASAVAPAQLASPTLAVDPDGPVLIAWHTCVARCTGSVRRWAPAGIGPPTELFVSDDGPRPIALAASAGHALAVWPRGDALRFAALAGTTWSEPQPLGSEARLGITDYHVELRWGLLGVAGWTSASPLGGNDATVAVYRE